MRFILFLKIRILQNLMFISTNHSVEVVHDVVHPLAVSCHYFIAHSCLVLLLILTLLGLLAALDKVAVVY